MNLRLDGRSFEDTASELAIANGGTRSFIFFKMNGAENPSGYVDFDHIFDSDVNQQGVDAMRGLLPLYEQPDVGEQSIGVGDSKQ